MSAADVAHKKTAVPASARGGSSAEHEAVSLAIAAAGAPAGEGLDPLGPSICVSVWILLADSRLTRSTALHRNADGQAHPLRESPSCVFRRESSLRRSALFPVGIEIGACVFFHWFVPHNRLWHAAGWRAWAGLPACRPSGTAGYRNSLWSRPGAGCRQPPRVLRPCCLQLRLSAPTAPSP